MAPGLSNEPVPLAASVRGRARLRVDDLVVLTIVSACALEASSKLLNVESPFARSLLVIAWTAAAARRLVAWRHGQDPVHLERLSQKLTVAACTVPLFVMQLLNPSAPGWSTSDLHFLPVWLQAVGAVSIMVSLLAPFCAGPGRMRRDHLRGPGRPRFSPPAVEFYARAIGFVLLTGSPSVVAAVCGCVVLRSWTESHGQGGSVSVASATFDSASSSEVSHRDGRLGLLPA
jgi:hypothetical protein